MIEKVNPCHPDKVADRIAGAIVDLAYTKSANPKVAVEVLLGHENCHIIAETSEEFSYDEVKSLVTRITGEVNLDLQVVKQDEHLAGNQSEKIRCGDNGIFKGTVLTEEQKKISLVARDIYKNFPTDGKYIVDNDRIIVCQSNGSTEDIAKVESLKDFKTVIINPLGDWTGGINVDSGATNRKLGSDMADSVTGGGLHGKDLSKADVSVNIYAFLKAQETNQTVSICCAIGDDTIDGKPYEEIVEVAREFINSLGGFEKFAEWGLY